MNIPLLRSNGRQVEPGPSRSLVTPSAMVAARERLGLISLAGAALVALLALAFVVWSQVDAHRVPIVFVVDGAGVVHSGPGARLSLESALFRRLSVRASQVALSRTCSDTGAIFDEAEELQLLYSEDGRRAIEADLSVQAPDFAARKLTQKVLVERTRALRERAGVRLIATYGKLDRRGYFSGRLIHEQIPYTAVLSFAPNPRLDQAGQYPFIVADVKVTLGNEITEEP